MRRFAQLLVLLPALCGLRAPPAACQPPAERPAYDALVSSLRSGNLEVDYTALRMAYAASDRYRPYDEHGSKKEMLAAFGAGDHVRARRLADAVLEDRFIDFDAHFVAMATAAELGDSVRARFHGTIAHGLMDSISGPGGRSPDSPMIVVEVAEEYSYLRLQGLQRLAQGLGECGGKACDHLRVRDLETGEEFDLYFDVSIPTGWLRRSLLKSPPQ